VAFLESESKLASAGKAIMASRDYFGFNDSNYSQTVPRQMIGVHLAAYFGLEDAMIAILKNGHDPDIKDTYGRTPLWWAAANGHESVAQLLLAKKGVDPDSRDTEYGETPLSWAAENGHETVVSYSGFIHTFVLERAPMHEA
jgi:ankyrin repeat protein